MCKSSIVPVMLVNLKLMSVVTHREGDLLLRCLVEKSISKQVMTPYMEGGGWHWSRAKAFSPFSKR